MFFHYFCIAKLIAGNCLILASAVSFSWPWSYSLDNSKNSDTKCSWIRNRQLLSSEIHRKRKIIETCLFDDLSTKFEQNKDKVDGFSLKDPPPITWGTDKPVTILVHDVTIRRFQRHNRQSTVNSIRGTALVSWLDSRLKWDPKEWYIDNMSATIRGEIWEPKDRKQTVFIYAKYRHQLRFFERNYESEFLDINVSYNGNVTATLSFVARVDCTSNEFYYPKEVAYCCSDFEYQNKIRTFKIASGSKKLIGQSKLYTYKFAVSKAWKISNVELKDQENYGSSLKESRDSDDESILKLCFEAQRSSILLKLEMNWPALTSGVLFLISPFFRSVRAQIFAKMFAILVQILCMQRLFDEMELSYLSTTPKIFLFYQMTFIFTLISFTLTLIFVGLHKNLKNASFRPPDRLLNVTAFFNRFWHFSKYGEKEHYNAGDENHDDVVANEDEVIRISSGAPATTGSSENHCSDKRNPVCIDEKQNYAPIWCAQFLALNDLSSFFIITLYITVILFILIL